MSKYYAPYQSFYNPLKRVCKKIISFDKRWNYLIYGRDIMNKKFLELIKKEKPDYIFTWVGCDEFDLDTLLNIRKISPKTQTCLFFGDDDTAFESFSRYFILFLDYGLIAQKKYISNYHKDGIKNVFFVMDIDTNRFKPLNLKKKYEVTFIGAPKGKASGRYELIKFLKENNVKIKLFGWDWGKYPEFKTIYGGPLDSDKMVEVLNQSKINLCFSKNHYGGLPQIKGKVFDTGACKTFVLAEYCEDYLELFKEGKEIVMFKDKKELLQKINYYLENEKQREAIAEAAHKKISKKYGLDEVLKNFFKETNKKNKKLVHNPLPRINKKIIPLSKKDLKLGLDKIKTKLLDYDYVFFKHGKCQNLKYRKYLQAYSLEKTKKPISCCSYYIHSKILGDYLKFSPERGSETLDGSGFIPFLNINQFMVTKDYFLENIEIFKGVFNGGEINFITKQNTAFVAYPLIRIKKCKSYNYETMRQKFEFKFLFQLFSLKYQKKLFLSPYSYALLLEIIKGKKFILKAIIDTLKDKSKKRKMADFEKVQE